ncbi:MAG: MFS transporter [Betaproteobacteria bacterium]|nr:MFS transporter [Betaproteobacteria bacterium]
MNAAQKTFLLLALAAANSGIAMRVAEPMLPRIADDFSASIPATAAIITAFALAQAGAQYFHGPFGDRYGTLRVVTILMALSALASFGCASADSLDGLTAWRFATGAFASGSMTLGLAYLADTVPAAGRQPIIARFISGTILGQAVGPFIGGGLTDLFDWRATFVVLGLVFAAVAIVLFILTRQSWAPPVVIAGPWLSPQRYISIMQRSRVRNVMASVFCETVCFHGAFAFLGVLLKLRFDLPFTLIGLLLAGFGIGGLLYTIVARWILVRIGQRGCVTVGGISGGVFYIAIALTPYWPGVMVCTMGLGFSLYMVHNTLQVKATEMAPDARATGLALFSMSWAGGQAVGAAAMGAAVATVGYTSMFILFGCGFTALALSVGMRLARH